MPDKKQLKGHSDGPQWMSWLGVWVLWHGTGWSDELKATVMDRGECLWQEYGAVAWHRLER